MASPALRTLVMASPALRTLVMASPGCMTRTGYGLTGLYDKGLVMASPALLPERHLVMASPSLLPERHQVMASPALMTKGLPHSLPSWRKPADITGFI